MPIAQCQMRGFVCIQRSALANRRTRTIPPGNVALLERCDLPEAILWAATSAPQNMLSNRSGDGRPIDPAIAVNHRRALAIPDYRSSIRRGNPDSAKVLSA